MNGPRGMVADWRASRGYRREWSSASTLDELGALTARWLEGGLPYYPAYLADGPDEETNALVPVLAAANRAGFVTDASQPAATDDARVEQRAAVSGFLAPPAARALAARADTAGLLVRLFEPPAPLRTDLTRRIPVTWVDGHPATAFGARSSRRQIRFDFEVCNRAALDALCGAAQLTLIDPDRGRDDRLWPLLAEWTVHAVNTRTDQST